MLGFVKGVLFLLLFAPLWHYISIFSLVVTSICAFFFQVLLLRSSQQRWQVHHEGFVCSGFERVAEAFKENVESGQERGAAFAVYWRGQLVVDLWGGYADHQTLRLRSSESTSMAYSATKAVTAICLARLYDRGLLDYDCPVAKYWPEFGQNGKDKISINMLLSHQAGLLSIEEKFKLSLARDDPEELGRLLAKQRPLWEPGSAQGYHALTFGLYADQLLRRADPLRRSLGTFFQEEIAKPFDIDFSIGEPKEQFYRACRESRVLYFGFGHFFTTALPTVFRFLAMVVYSVVKFRKIYLLRLFGNPSDVRPWRFNDPEFREIECGSSNGFGTARGLARLMGIVANGGEANGRVLLKPGAIERLSTPLSSGLDRVVLRDITYGPGTQIINVTDENAKSHQAFGHFGAGGQMAFCDPQLRIGWSYLTNNRNLLHGFINDHRYESLERAMYQCINALNKR